jgi:hypothetical protein
MGLFVILVPILVLSLFIFYIWSSKILNSLTENSLGVVCREFWDYSTTKSVGACGVHMRHKKLNSSNYNQATTMDQEKSLDC